MTSFNPGGPMLNVKLLTAKASIGDPVKNKAGEVLGTISDVLFHPDILEPEYAVLNFPEGDKEFAIPFGELTFIGEEGYYILPSTVMKLKDLSEGFHFRGKFYFRYSN